MGILEGQPQRMEYIRGVKMKNKRIAHQGRGKEQDMTLSEKSKKGEKGDKNVKMKEIMTAARNRNGIYCQSQRRNSHS